VDPKAGLDNMQKRKFLTLQRLELHPHRRPTRSQSLAIPTTLSRLLKVQRAAVTIASQISIINCMEYRFNKSSHIIIISISISISSSSSSSCQ
jgi:hypothetical protein